MGNYWYSSEIKEKPLQSYTINSYGDANNLIIDRIEKDNNGDLVIYYKSPENL